MSNLISDILSSSAKLKVLETLNYQTSPCGLREIAYSSELPLRSVELALKSLLKAKIVSRKKLGKYFAFSINKKHLYYPALNKLFVECMKVELSQRALSYSKKAKSSLKFINDTHKMFDEIRK